MWWYSSVIDLVYVVVSTLFDFVVLQYYSASVWTVRAFRAGEFGEFGLMRRLSSVAIEAWLL